MKEEEKRIFQQSREIHEKIQYLKDIELGIPAAEVESLEEDLSVAELLIHQKKFYFAESKLKSIISGFDLLVEQYFSQLTPRHIDSISRSEQRPKTLDYAFKVFDSFEEIKGLDANSADPAVVCGLAKLEGLDVIVVGHEKGRFEESYRRGGSALPQGNSKAIQAMKLAESFGIPVVTFIDTPGSWPLEEFLPAQRIAKNLEVQYFLRIPHVSVVIGEGGSGGALAIDLCDYRIMLDKAYYSVISVSGGAAIIARDKRHITDEDLNRAAYNLKLTAYDAQHLGIVDRVVPEPSIGVRKCDGEFYQYVRKAIIEGLDTIRARVSPFFFPDYKSTSAWRVKRYQIPILLRKRWKKYRRIGEYHSSALDRIRHILGELYRVRWFHSIFAPVRKMIDLHIKRKTREEESLLGAEEQPKTLSYEDRWVECPNTAIHDCQDIWVPTLFEEYSGTCPHCGFHFRLIIDNYIDLLADKGSFREFNEGLESVNPLGFEGFDDKLRKAKSASKRKCAMITGHALIAGYPVIMVLTDVRFRAGTLGSAEGEKFIRAVKRALREKKPIIAVHQSGGARIEEGLLALMQMVKTSIAVTRFRASGGLYISVQTDPTMAGVLASYASLGDFTVAEPNAQIGFAGIHVIEQTVKQKKPKYYQHSEMVMGRGGVDLVVKRSELKSTIAGFLDLKKVKRRGGRA
jgi:acetyl-CoA carboxylase carboxyl transferase subunit beta